MWLCQVRVPDGRCINERMLVSLCVCVCVCVHLCIIYKTRECADTCIIYFIFLYPVPPNQIHTIYTNY